MIIKQASDLHFTYVRNTPELREAFINKCKEFGIRIFGFGGENYLEVYSDGYDEFEICGTDDLEPQSKKLTMSDLTGIPTETPEEKEVLDGIESAGEVEWKNGDECRYNEINWLFCGFHPVNRLAIVANNDVPSSHQVITVDVDLLSKPETPQQRKDRERLEVIDEMCWDVHSLKFSQASALYEAGYRKEKTHGTN